MWNIEKYFGCFCFFTFRFEQYQNMCFFLGLESYILHFQNPNTQFFLFFGFFHISFQKYGTVVFEKNRFQGSENALNTLWKTLLQ